MTKHRTRLRASRRELLTWSSLFGVGAVVPGLAAYRPRGAAAQEGDWTAPPDVEKAREQAKEYVTYGMPDGWANYGGVLEAFAAKHGFELKHIDTDMTSMEEIAKYDAEKDNPIAISSDIGLIYGVIAEERGVVPPYLPPSAEKLPPGLKAETGGWVATFTGVPSFVVNADVIENVPATWDDLLKEEFKGKIGMRDPRTAGEAATAFLAWSFAHGGDENNQEPGIEFAKQLLPLLGPREGNPQELEKGEVPIQIKYDFNCVAAATQVQEKGVNAKVVIPGVSIYAPSAVMINKYNTAKMDVAKLFLDFVLSDEAQIEFAEFGARPIRYVLGDLQLPDEAKAKWLPDADYADVKQVADWTKVDAMKIADTWDEQVLGG